MATGLWPQNIDERLADCLRKRLKWRSPTHLQNIVFLELANNNDILLQARPGAGKTGAFLIPAINSFIEEFTDGEIISKKPSDRASKSPYALILEPSRELCYQASQVCKVMSSSIPKLTVLDTAVINSENDMERMLACNPAFIISTPSRILPHLLSGKVSLDGLKYLIIDEADMLYTFGYRDDMMQLKQYLPKSHTTFLATATMSDNVNDMKRDFMQKTTKICMKEDENGFSENLLQYKINCTQDAKYTIMFAIFKLRLLTGKTLIFVNSVNQCYKLKIFLEQFGINSCIINPELPLNSRLHALEEFNNGKYSILIASDMSLVDIQKMKGVQLDEKDNSVHNKQEKDQKSSELDQEFTVSRGIDFQGVKNILNFDCPLSVDSYVHRVGRTARFESRGYALTFVTDHELYGQEKQGSVKKSSGAPIGSASVFAGINEATDNRIKNFNFKMEDIDAMRYRCDDTVKKITKQVIKKYRIKEIKLQILNSEKLSEYFEAHASDKTLLRKQIKKPIIKKQPHLQFLPDYLVPKFRSKELNSSAKKSKKSKSTNSHTNKKDGVENTKTYHSSIISKTAKKKKNSKGAVKKSKNKAAKL